MDPNANLEQQLAGAREILRSQADDGGGYDDGVIDLAEAVVALNEWIKRGGFLPEAWRGGDFERIEQLDEGKTLNVKLTSEGIIADRVDAEGEVESSWALTYGELDERLY